MEICDNEEGEEFLRRHQRIFTEKQLNYTTRRGKKSGFWQTSRACGSTIMNKEIIIQQSTVEDAEKVVIFQSVGI